jgi:hypothetical protein
MPFALKLQIMQEKPEDVTECAIVGLPLRGGRSYKWLQ